MMLLSKMHRRVLLPKLQRGFIFMGGGGRAAAGYQIQRSLRFRKSASASASRTPGATGNRKLLARRFRIKRGETGTLQVIASAGTASIDRFYFDSSDRLCLDVLGTTRLVTNAVKRDPTAWMLDIGLELDVANATAALRAKITIDGVEATYSTDSRASIANNDTNWNNTVIHYLGRDNAGNYFDGYMAELIGVDGATVATYTSVDGVTGQLVAARPSATWGTTGYSLDFSDPTSTTTLGYDRSGNANHWTLSGVSLTAGASYDSMLDVPLGSGGAERGNYMTWNPLNSNSNGAVPCSDGNLKGFGENGSAYWRGNLSTFPVDASGNWWAEFTLSFGGSSGATIGIVPPVSVANVGMDLIAQTGALSYRDNGQKHNASGTGSAYGATYTSTDVIGVHLNAGTLTLHKQTGGVGAFASQGVAFTGLTGLYNFFMAMFGSSGNYWIANFGQRPFNNTSLPTGAKAPHTGNLPTPTGAALTPASHYRVVLDTGANIKTTAEAVFPSNFLEKIKDRANVNNWQLADTVRGNTAILYPNSSGVEGTYTAPSGSSVATVWKLGGASVSNTQGTITSQVSVNSAAGISVITYPGNNTAGATVGHGLPDVPKLTTIKRRNTGAGSWIVNHSAIGTGFMLWEGGAAYSAAATYWSAAPTSLLLPTLTGNAEVNGLNNYVAIAHCEIPGYSKFDKFTANNTADNAYVHVGFDIGLLWIKNANGTGNWVEIDATRQGYNPQGPILLNSGNVAESSPVYLYFCAGGFKIVSTNGDVGGASVYAYCAWARSHFKFANAR